MSNVSHKVAPPAPMTERVAPLQVTGMGSYLTRLTLVMLILQAVLVFTGAAVRLTGSGLGCSDWPTCTPTSLTTTPELGIHGFIEFGNRVLGAVLGLYAVFFVYALWPLRRTRADLVRMAILLFAVVPFQAILGGITVKTELNPWIVAAHFAPSAIAVALATYMLLRTRDAGGPARKAQPPVTVGLAWTAGILCAIVVILGVMVTGAGPHAGDQASARNGFSTLIMARLHAAPVWLMTLTTIAGLIVTRSKHARPAGHDYASQQRPRAAFLFLLIVEVIQGAIGYTQYFTGLPVPLVMAHIVGLCMVIIAAVCVVDSVYEREPVRAH